MNARVWPVIVTAGLGVAVLCGLGTWQVQRLAWKQSLIADVEARLQAPPADLATALAAAEAGGDVEYLKVTARGRFLHADEKLMIDTFDGMAGWRVITPLVSGNGIAVLVDRGIVPDDLRATDKRAAAAPDAPVEVTGILRRHATARDLFSPDNDPAGNLWYWWDVPAMLAASHIPADVKVAPFVVQALPVDRDRGFPRPQDAQAALRNSHLQYAITWFALAAGLAVIAFLYVRGRGTDS